MPLFNVGSNSSTATDKLHEIAVAVIVEICPGGTMKI
jgi:hypothetical protein